MTYFTDIIEYIEKEKPSKLALAKYKVKLCKIHKLKTIPTDIEILLNVENIPKFKKYLQSKPSRSISGVTPVAVMLKPIKCPHGKCRMCPGGPDSAFGNIPQSYTGFEPSTMRAKRSNYDPYLIVFNRLEQFIVQGHFPDKVELILQGGTFPAFPKAYQEKSVMLCLKAMNDFSKLFFKKNEFNYEKFKTFFELPGKVNDIKRMKSIFKKIKELKASSTLEREQKRNENSNIRCVGLTIETRPDYGLLKHGNEMLKLGATRIELGVQSVYDKALTAIERGHDLEKTKQSIQELLDLGFKLNFHYMIGLPKTTKKQDLEGLKELFSNPEYKPDMLKIYPCMVMPGTKLHNDYKKNLFKPLTTSEAAEMIAKFKKYVPEYCRIMRVQRDIPTSKTIAGVDKTNLRQYVEKLNPKCRCIRCREPRREVLGKITLTIKEYDHANGKEFFIAAEDLKKDKILGFCRLRFPSNSLRKEITNNSALVRELHVYGSSTQIGKKGIIQHKGIGQKLMKKAESIAKKNKKNKIIVISGIGVRQYYKKKLNYKQQGPYVVKSLV